VCRFVRKDDPVRLKSSDHYLRNDTGFQFYCTESRGEPTIFGYNHYKHAGEEAMRTGTTVDGVKELWVLDTLPYVDHGVVAKDWMHTTMNTIRRSLSAFHPDDKYNRTMLMSCRRDCESKKIHKHLWPDKEGKIQKPKWSLSVAEMKEVDNKLNYIVCCPGAFVPKKIFENEVGKRRLTLYDTDSCLQIGVSMISGADMKSSMIL
jgi:hypothetical protein